MNYQITNSILMIRPVQFRMNEQTAVNNYYQKSLSNINPTTINTKAIQEFDVFVEKLKKVPKVPQNRSCFSRPLKSIKVPPFSLLAVKSICVKWL